MALLILLLSFSLILPSLAVPTQEHSFYQFLPEIPSPRQEHAVAFLDSKLYIIGGITTNISYTPDTIDEPSSRHPVDLVQVYDTTTESWSNVAPLPFSINHANVAVVRDRIYLLGGLSGTNAILWDGISNSFVYDPVSNTWSEIDPMPPGSARGACAVGVKGAEIYLAGGLRSLEVGEGGFQDSVAEVSSYNVDTGVWKTNYPSLPGRRDHVGGAVVGNKFYVTGGRDRGQGNVHGETWALDLGFLEDGWETLASMPTARGGIAAAAVEDLIYTFGGEGNLNRLSGVFDDVEVYDTKADRWEKLAPLWTGIHGTQAVAGVSKIYMPGGGYSMGASSTNVSVVFHV